MWVSHNPGGGWKFKRSVATSSAAMLCILWKSIEARPAKADALSNNPEQREGAMFKAAVQAITIAAAR
jgi:hypothetical protein